MDPQYLWSFLPWGYALTVAIEILVLLACMSRDASLLRRVTLGLLMTAFTYPIVVLVLPLIVWPMWGYTAYVTIAEVFAPLAECWLFSQAMGPVAGTLASWNRWRDWGAIVAANLASFLGGGYLAGLVWA